MSLQESRESLIMSLNANRGVFVCALCAGFGQFTEVGPVDMDDKWRQFAWTERAHVLFVDNPVGTGFSYVEEGGTFGAPMPLRVCASADADAVGCGPADPVRVPMQPRTTNRSDWIWLRC